MLEAVETGGGGEGVLTRYGTAVETELWGGPAAEEARQHSHSDSGWRAPAGTGDRLDREQRHFKFLNLASLVWSISAGNLRSLLSPVKF